MSRRLHRKIGFFFICLLLVIGYSLRLGGTGGTIGREMMPPHELRYDMHLATVGTKIYVNISASDSIEIYFMNYTQFLKFYTTNFSEVSYLYYYEGKKIEVTIQVPYTGVFYFIMNNTNDEEVVVHESIIVEYWNYAYIPFLILFSIIGVLAIFSEHIWLHKVPESLKKLFQDKTKNRKYSKYEQDNKKQSKISILLKQQIYSVFTYYNILALSLIILIIIGGFTLIESSNVPPVNVNEYIRSDLRRQLYEFLIYSLPLYSIGFSTLLATSLFSNEYEKGYLAVQLSLPIERKELFFTKVLGGLVFLLVPFIVVPTAVIMTNTYTSVPKAKEMALMTIPYMIFYNIFLFGVCVLINIILKRSTQSALFSFTILTFLNVYLIIFPSYEFLELINPFEAFYTILVGILEFVEKDKIPISTYKLYFSISYVIFSLLILYILAYQIFKRQDIP